MEQDGTGSQQIKIYDATNENAKKIVEHFKKLFKLCSKTIIF
jgi:hypothetical protein